MSWPLLPVPIDDRALARPVLAVAILARMQHRPSEILQRRDVGDVWDAADAGRDHDMAGMHLARRAVAVAQHDGPAAFRLVIRAAFERRARPVVQLQRFDIGLEPVRNLVLRDVGRERRRKRHVGQVIDLHLIVQRECVIAQAPVVADARASVDDQRIDAECAEPRRDGKTRLSAANDQHIRVTIRESRHRLALIEPVRPAEVARVRLPARPQRPGALFVSLQLVERGAECPCFHAVTAVDEADNATAAAKSGLETKQRFGVLRTGTRDLTRRGAVRVEREVGGADVVRLRAQRRCDRLRAAHRLDGPRERQHIAPIAVGNEEILQRSRVGASERALELREPLLDIGVDGCRSVEHDPV